jgi:hypothetical protein
LTDPAMVTVIPVKAGIQLGSRPFRVPPAAGEFAVREEPR